MTTTTLAGINVELNDEGFSLSKSMDRSDGRGTRSQRRRRALTERQWQVIRFMRSEYLAKGTDVGARARQDVRRHHQRALSAVSQGTAKTPPRLPAFQAKGCI